VVGLVLVSHSHEVAEGVAALARQMGGADLSIATAGGLEATGEEHPVGTDAVRILEALEQVWSEDGVLVLMDLGSASIRIVAGRCDSRARRSSKAPCRPLWPRSSAALWTPWPTKRSAGWRGRRRISASIRIERAELERRRPRTTPQAPRSGSRS